MLTRLLMSLLALACAVPALAQKAEVAPSPMLDCLISAPGAPITPEYPELLRKAKFFATINVELTFEGPDAKPSVRIEKNTFEPEFSEAVHSFARTLRLPCMQPGQKPVVLKQRYEFDPTDGRKTMPPLTEDPSHASRRLEARCMAHLRKGAQPEYPNIALWKGRMGKVMTRLQFHRPDAPPKVTVLVEIGGPEFRAAVKEYLAWVRLPCMDTAAGPINIDQVFEFHAFDGPREFAVLNDMSLLDLLGIAKDLAPISVDTAQMACPFDVRFTYYQPYLNNRVVEIENSHVARKPLLEWLGKLQLNVSKDIGDVFFSDQFTVTIPCVKIEP